MPTKSSTTKKAAKAMAIVNNVVTEADTTEAAITEGAITETDVPSNTESKLADSALLDWEESASPVFKIAFTAINKGTNIRSENNVIKTAGDLRISILENGIVSPLIVNNDFVLLDGYRRLYCLEEIIKQNPNFPKEVPVIKIDVKEKEIPLFQYLTTQRLGITTKEETTALYNFALRNPGLTDLEIGQKFNKTSQAVGRITSTIRVSLPLAELVQQKIVSQNLVSSLVTAVNKGSIAKEQLQENVPARIKEVWEDKKIRRIDKAKKDFPALKKLPDDEVFAQISVPPLTAKEFMTSVLPSCDIDARALGQVIASEKEQDEEEKKEKEVEKSKKAKLKDISKEFQELTLKESIAELIKTELEIQEDNRISLSVSAELLIAICVKAGAEIPESLQSIVSENKSEIVKKGNAILAASTIASSQPSSDTEKSEEPPADRQEQIIPQLVETSLFEDNSTYAPPAPEAPTPDISNTPVIEKQKKTKKAGADDPLKFTMEPDINDQEEFYTDENEEDMM